MDENNIHELKENTEDVFIGLQDELGILLENAKIVNQFIDNENNLQKIKFIKNEILNLYE